MTNNPKDVKSFRLSEDVIINLNKLSKHYQERYWEQGLRNKISAANVVEILVNEKINQIKGEK